ncbi:hypothetical protein N9030_01225, partial [bacterium]|nr:hypothetical protein [bacterium]
MQEQLVLTEGVYSVAFSPAGNRMEIAPSLFRAETFEAIPDKRVLPTVEGNVGIWFDITRMRVQFSLNIRLYGELNHDTKTEAILPGIHGRPERHESGGACW